MIVLQVIKHGFILYILIVSDTCNRGFWSHDAAINAALEAVDVPNNIAGAN